MRSEIDISEVSDFPSDLKIETPRVNSQRWNLQEAILIAGLPIMGGILGLVLGQEISTVFHANPYAAEGIKAFGAYLGIVAGIALVYPRTLNRI